MFHRCLPAAASAAPVLRAPARARGGKSRGGGKLFTIDIHCHLFTPEAEGLVKPHFKPEHEPFLAFANQATVEVNRRQAAAIGGRIAGVDERLAEMDAAGIDMQAISPTPHQYHYWAPPELGRQTAQTINDRIAEVVAGHPERFVGLGTLPMQAPEMAVAEMERLVRLGFRGVEINTNVNGVDLSDPRFRPFWAKAEELGIVVFLHPGGFTEGRRLADHYLINVIGNPLESTIAVSHLIFGGVLEDYPKLKICVAHGGGFLPAYAGRMDHAHAAREDCRRVIAKPPTHYLKKLYFDTVVFTTHQLAYLAQEYGANHLLLGTDYPYDMGEADPVGLVDRTPGLSDQARAAILGGTAAKLLKIRPPKAPKAKVAKKATAKGGAKAGGKGKGKPKTKGESRPGVAAGAE